MSNAIAGDIFAKIIANVVEQSKTDFEENGVSRQILQELQMSWQKKLSERQVAHMPWDPQPTVDHIPAQTRPVANTPHGIIIKNEPTAMPEYPPVNVAQPNSAELAAARAATLLQETFGKQADASADAIRQRGSGGIALPGQPPAGVGMAVSSVQPGNDGQAPGNGQNPIIKQEGGLSYSQNDGAEDRPESWADVMAARRAATTEKIADGDAKIRLAALRAPDSDNGIMRPLSSKRAGKRAVVTGPSSAGMSQVDGADDEDDEDAINSDLDDPDDAAHANGEDDDDIQSMLCTYDKVHRAKNRWKCHLKDGILMANGKEYLFNRAQGDFEW